MTWLHADSYRFWLLFTEMGVDNKAGLDGKSSSGSSNRFSLKLHQPFESILNVRSTNLSRLSNLLTAQQWKANGGLRHHHSPLLSPPLASSIWKTYH